MKTRSFKDFIVWQKAYQLVLEIYKTTKNFPKLEIYCLVSQMRRAAISIPSNISEGYARQHKLEYRQFLSTAYGSLCELETQALLSKDLQYISEWDYKRIEELAREVGSMLYRMIHPISRF
jgi:four helix bundle protein